MRATDCIDVWLDSTALAVFSDRKVGILKGPQPDVVVSSPSRTSGMHPNDDGHCEGDSPPAPLGPGDSPKQSPADGRKNGAAAPRNDSVMADLVKSSFTATGAREKSLAFAATRCPASYGAGAFQTLVNP